MAADLNLLQPDFRAKVDQLLQKCKDQGIEMRPNEGLRDPFTQDQWGFALDCFWVVDGQAEWSVKRLVNGKNGFQVYAAVANQIGLTAGGLWTSLKDWPHVQMSRAASPLGEFTLEQIDAAMKSRFGQQG